MLEIFQYAFLFVFALVLAAIGHLWAVGLLPKAFTIFIIFVCISRTELEGDDNA